MTQFHEAYLPNTVFSTDPHAVNAFRSGAMIEAPTRGDLVRWLSEHDLLADAEVDTLWVSAGATIRTPGSPGRSTRPCWPLNPDPIY